MEVLQHCLPRLQADWQLNLPQPVAVLLCPAAALVTLEPDARRSGARAQVRSEWSLASIDRRR